MTAVADASPSGAVTVLGFAELVESFGIKKRRAQTIAQQTLNRGADRLKTRITRRIRDELKLPYAYAAKRVIVSKASFDNDKLEARVSANYRAILLSRFGAQQVVSGGKRAGVSVFVTNDGGRKTLPGAFLVQLKPGNRAADETAAAGGASLFGIAVPKDKGDKRHGRPYTILYGPSASMIFNKNHAALVEDTRQWLTGELDRRFNVELNIPGTGMPAEPPSFGDDE